MTLKIQTRPDGTEVKMWRLPNGQWIEVAYQDEIGAMLRRPVLGKTYGNYVLWKTPKNDPAPGPVGMDVKTRRYLYPVEKILAWDKRRPGPGDRTAGRWANPTLKAIQKAVQEGEQP
jgi:hypothetical protein